MLLPSHSQPPTLLALASFSKTPCDHLPPTHASCNQSRPVSYPLLSPSPIRFPAPNKTSPPHHPKPI
ncbi:hypothetical protein QUC31_000868 [Theobroma cacao]